MASKAFAAVAAGIKASKNLDSVIVGGPMLGEGTHDVTIQAVDTSGLDEGKLNVTYVADDGRAYTDRMFVMSQDQAEFSFSLRMLWSAVLADKDAIGALIDATANDNAALEVLTGMRVRITLAQGKGAKAHSLGNGKFVGQLNGEAVTPEFEKIQDVYDFCKANSIKRSFLQSKHLESIAKDANLAAFNKAMADRPKAARIAKAV